MKKNQSENDSPLHQTVAEGYHGRRKGNRGGVHRAEVERPRWQRDVIELDEWDGVAGNTRQAIAACGAAVEPSSHRAGEGAGVLARVVMRSAQADGKRPTGY